MADLYVLFHKPKSWLGNIICWRTHDEFSHSYIVVGNHVYDSIFPFVRKKSLIDQIDKADLILQIKISEIEEQMARAYADAHVGAWYDVLAMLGWLFGNKDVQFRNNTYCHEFCREVFVRMARLEWSGDLITAKRLVTEFGVWDEYKQAEAEYQRTQSVGHAESARGRAAHRHFYSIGMGLAGPASKPVV